MYIYVIVCISTLSTFVDMLALYDCIIIVNNYCSLQAMSSMNKHVSPEKMMQDMKKFQMESDKMEMKEELSK